MNWVSSAPVCPGRTLRPAGGHRIHLSAKSYKRLTCRTSPHAPGGAVRQTQPGASRSMSSARRTPTMNRLHCLGCGQAAYLRNDWCTRCQAPLGFSTEQWAFMPLDAAEARGERPCAHRDTGFCHWLGSVGRPEVDQPVYWLELAKRRLLLSLRELGLPALPGETRLPLRFAFLEDLPDQPP